MKTSHLADDQQPHLTACGEPWEYWQDPDKGSSLEEVVAAVPTQVEKAEVREADRLSQPQPGEFIRQCQACFKRAMEL
jgi:hypothetical protein